VSKREARPPEMLAKFLCEGIIKRVAKHAGIAVTNIDSNKSLVDYGLNSVDLLELHFYICDMTGAEVEPELLWETPSISALVSAVASAKRDECASIVSRAGFLGS
jgi:acyl carrier protein